MSNNTNNLGDFRGREGSPLVVNFGAGVDSTAILVGLVRLHRLGYSAARPDLVLFADTGNELAETYEHVETFSAWLVAQGFPAVTRVSRPDNIRTKANYATIVENCLANETLPSEAFNLGSCSMKWKHEPMDAFLRGRKRPYQRGWLDANGYDVKPTKLIGYDATESASGKRSKWAKVSETDEAFFAYPLVVWGWSRLDCMEAIRAEGLEVPHKSACALCPNQKPAELAAMRTDNPSLLFRALVVEDVARLGVIGFEKVAGLWRKGTKSLPGSWIAYVREQGWLADLERQAGSTLRDAVLAVFRSKLAELDAGAALPFRRATLVRRFGERDDADLRELVREHYALVVAELSALRLVA